MTSRPAGSLAGAAAGLAGVGAFLGVAELAAAVTGPGSAPAVAIGQAAIARTPEWLKQFAIAHFGENDKTVLKITVYVALALAAAAVGALGVRTRRWVALAATGVLAGVSSLSATTRPDASLAAAFPSLLGAVAAAGGFVLLTRPRQLNEPAGAEFPGLPAAPDRPPLSRRQLLVGAGSLAAFAAATYALGRETLRRTYNAVSSRAAVRLPRPTSRTPDVPGTGFDVPGLAPYVTPNSEFYRVDTALVVPQVSTETYRLKIHGMVERPRTFSFQELLDMPLIERPITMICVSNPVGGPYIGNARWLGVPLAHVLDLVGVRSAAEQIFMTSSDGMTIGADLQSATDGRPAMLAVGMNGEPLPFEHGFPVRAVIPGVYGYASACKWLVDIELTTYAARRAYWVQRGYAPKAPIKLESRIDTPVPFAQLRRGPVTVAGSAWHPTVGIASVEVRVDGGSWRKAALAEVESADTWRLWRWQWHALPGTHTLEVRAIDRDGHIQSAIEKPVFPNGASGRDSVVVTVS